MHVVGFHSQQLLKRIGGAISFQRPHLHFTETLAAILGFTAERLLRDKRVRSDRARVNFIGHQVTELHHIDIADYDFLIERIARPTIEQSRLPIFLHPAEAFDFLRVL